MNVDPMLLTALDCRDSLHTFITEMWDVHEEYEFHDNWHIHEICEHVQACIDPDGPIQNLIINMPPRHGKSWVTGIAAVPWTWLWAPATRFLYVSYAIDLSKDFAIKSRDLISAEKYQQMKYQLSALPDHNNWAMNKRQDTNMKYANTRGGDRFSTAVTAKTTGFGGHVIIADDVQNVQQAESKTERARAINFWDRTLASRQNNPKKIRKILIMHRLHTSDMTQHVLDKAKESGEKWDHLVIPGRYSKNHPIPSNTALNFKDPRTEEGEVLWKGFYDEKELSILEINMGKYAAAGQINQTPVPEGGAILNRNDFKPMSDAEIAAIFNDGRVLMKISSWDCASTEKDDKESSYTVRWTVLVYESIPDIGEEPDYRFLLMGYEKGRMETPEVIKAIWRDYENQQQMGKALDWIIVEEKSSGIAAVQTIRHAAPVHGYQPQGDKPSRVRAVSPYVEGGCVGYPAGSSKIQEGIDELSDYPFGREDDTADAFSQALIVLTQELGYVPKPFTFRFLPAGRAYEEDEEDGN